MMFPISSSAAEMAATRAICSLPPTSFDCFSRRFYTTESTTFSMPRRSPSGLAPAATFLRPWRTTACSRRVAVAEDGLCEQGGGGGSGRGHVVGRERVLADQLGPLVLEGALDLDLPSDGD